MVNLSFQQQEKNVQISNLIIQIDRKMNKGSQEIRCKVLLLGQSAVGKTSLFKQFMEESVSRITPTIGVQFRQKITKTSSGTPLKLQLWDTAGTQRYRTISPIYYRNLDGVLLIFDLTDINSFRSIDYWFDELTEKGQSAAIVLVGNKNDLKDQRQVSFQQTTKKAKQLNVVYMQACSLDYRSTLSIFERLIGLIETSKKLITIRTQENEDSLQQNVKLSQFPRRQNKTQQNCC